MNVKLSDNSIRQLPFEKPRFGYVKFLARPLRRFALQWHGLGSRTQIVATPPDFESLALPLAAILRARALDVSCSCVWPSLRLVGKEMKTEIAPISMSYDESPLDDENTDLILVSSIVDTTTQIESMLSYAHPISEMKYRSISVFVPFAQQGALREFRLALRESELDTFAWQNSFQFSEESKERLHLSVNTWIAAALNLPSPEAVKSYFPRSVTAHLNEQPRPEISSTPEP